MEADQAGSCSRDGALSLWKVIGGLLKGLVTG